MGRSATCDKVREGRFADFSTLKQHLPGCRLFHVKSQTSRLQTSAQLKRTINNINSGMNASDLGKVFNVGSLSCGMSRWASKWWLQSSNGTLGTLLCIKEATRTVYSQRDCFDRDVHFAR